MAKAVVLDVAVVGAGIAGLSAAVAIARSGHNVEVSLALSGEIYIAVQLT